MLKKINLREKLEKQLETVKARLESVKAREKTSERKIDTRRKILVGTYFLEQAKMNNTMEEIKNIMDGFLKRDFDREIFGLQPLTENEKKM